MESERACGDDPRESGETGGFLAARGNHRVVFSAGAEPSESSRDEPLVWRDVHRSRRISRFASLHTHAASIRRDFAR
jgi:hypothetical protein